MIAIRRTPPRHARTNAVDVPWRSGSTCGSSMQRWRSVSRAPSHALSEKTPLVERGTELEKAVASRPMVKRWKRNILGMGRPPAGKVRCLGRSQMRRWLAAIFLALQGHNLSQISGEKDWVRCIRRHHW